MHTKTKKEILGNTEQHKRKNFPQKNKVKKQDHRNEKLGNVQEKTEDINHLSEASLKLIRI